MLSSCAELCRGTLVVVAFGWYKQSYIYILTQFSSTPRSTYTFTMGQKWFKRSLEGLVKSVCRLREWIGRLS